MEKDIKNEDNLPKYSIPRNLYVISLHHIILTLMIYRNRGTCPFRPPSLHQTSWRKFFHCNKWHFYVFRAMFHHFQIKVNIHQSSLLFFKKKQQQDGLRFQPENWDFQQELYKPEGPNSLYLFFSIKMKNSLKMSQNTKNMAKTVLKRFVKKKSRKKKRKLICSNKSIRAILRI